MVKIPANCAGAGDRNTTKLQNYFNTDCSTIINFFKVKSERLNIIVSISGWICWMFYMHSGQSIKRKKKLVKMFSGQK